MVSSAALVEILPEAKLWLKLSRALILGFGTRPEGELKPEDSLKSCLSEVEAEVGLQIILEPDCTRAVLVNLELLELHQPPLLWLLIELSLSLKKGEKHTVASNVFNSVETSVFNICCWAVLIYFPRWNTLGDSSHSFEFWKFLKAQSALKFNLSRRYSVVTMISLVIVNYQISLKMAIFIIYERALILPTWKWTNLKLNIFKNVKRASLMAKNSRTLI